MWRASGCLRFLDWVIAVRHDITGFIRLLWSEVRKFRPSLEMEHALSIPGRE